MNAGAQAQQCRRSAGLFRLADRGLIVVEGGDRVRWLNGMLTNDVARLAAGREGSGCLALLLTRIGRIVADLHVLLRGDVFWLECAAEAVAPVLATLGKFIIADDVRLSDATAAWERLALEGPASHAIFAAVTGQAAVPAPDSADLYELAGLSVVAGAWGVSGEAALQLFMPAGQSPLVCEALRDAGAAHALLEADAEALEILRIEAGTPRFGHELSESVLPAEAALQRAISTTKGCYTGQEIVARMAIRGEASHALVGLALTEGSAAAAGAAVTAEGVRAGELTSVAHSASAGAIALAYVRRAHAAPDTRLEVAGEPARVTALPFVVLRSSSS